MAYVFPSDSVLSPQAGAPLAGVIVIEHGKGVAASYAGRILAMMGATVIKLEVPRGGDALRYETPMIGATKQISAIFTYLNVNKAIVTLDLSIKEGGQILSDLLERATIFIDDTHPQTRMTWQLMPHDICSRHPDLIYLSVLPFGGFGPYSDYRATEINVFHSSGEGYLLPNGLSVELFPDRSPIKPYGHLGEYQGGLSAALAGMAALLALPETRGQTVDVSVQDANVALSAMTIQRFGDGILETRSTRSFTYGGVLECQDGFVQILLLEQRQWNLMLNMLGSPSWATAPGMEDAITRGQRGKAINEHLRAWAKTKRVDEAVAMAKKAQVPLGKYFSPQDIAQSEHERARGFVGEIALSDGTEVTMPIFPFRLAESPAPTLRHAAGAPGAHNADVYTNLLKYPAETLERWRSLGVI
jgi:crotonobetainyl-CoA:carnitine CoA-transferase CaiB-like acyl-CoA transferase